MNTITCENYSLARRSSFWNEGNDGHYCNRNYWINECYTLFTVAKETVEQVNVRLFLSRSYNIHVLFRSFVGNNIIETLLRKTCPVATGGLWWT